MAQSIRNACLAPSDKRVARHVSGHVAYLMLVLPGQPFRPRDEVLHVTQNGATSHQTIDTIWPWVSAKAGRVHGLRRESF